MQRNCLNFLNCLLAFSVITAIANFCYAETLESVPSTVSVWDTETGNATALAVGGTGHTWRFNAMIRPYKAVNQNYDIELVDYYIEQTLANSEITLPSANNIAGKTFNIDNSSSSDVLLIPSFGDTIEGETQQYIPPQSAVTVVSNGFDWRIK